MERRLVKLYKSHKDTKPFYQRYISEAAIAVHWIERMTTIYKCLYDVTFEKD